jgi:ABC-type metal ion transport system substrate-binding protein
LPSLSKLNVPASPYARQNLLLDCTNPTEKTKAGTKIEIREDRDWSVANKAVAEEIVRKIPNSATN